MKVLVYLTIVFRSESWVNVWVNVLKKYFFPLITDISLFTESGQILVKELYFLAGVDGIEKLKASTSGLSWKNVQFPI